jgi:polysaccharide export outer membrane protein
LLSVASIITINCLILYEQNARRTVPRIVKILIDNNIYINSLLTFMKKLCLLLVILLSQTVQAKPYLYTIHAGDLLDISVWNEDSLTRELRVLPDGSISFPLSGVMIVAGKSLQQIQIELTERLIEFIPEAEVNVSVKSADGNAVYVIGQVKKPGRFLMLEPMDVMQLLSLAGGLTAFAKANDILILRRNKDFSKKLQFEYGEIEEGDRLNTNYLLETGDVIVVP